MSRKQRINPKMIWGIATFAICLVVFGVLLYFKLSTNTTQVEDTTSISLLANEVVTNDPTKITLPDWAELIIEIGIWVVVGLLSIGIIIFAIYIIWYFYNRTHKKNHAVIRDFEENKQDDSQNLIRISLGKEVVNNEEAKEK